MYQKNINVIYQRPSISGRKGWAKTCVGICNGLGSKGIVGDYLNDGEQLIEEGTLVVSVCPHGSASNPSEMARVLMVTPDGLLPCIPRFYSWRLEHVSLRAKLIELLAAQSQIESQEFARIANPPTIGKKRAELGLPPLGDKRDDMTIEQYLRSIEGQNAP